jgi:hypothetical protein
MDARSLQERRGQQAEAPGRKAGNARILGARRARNLCPSRLRSKHPPLAAAADFPLPCDGGHNAERLSSGGGPASELVVLDETQTTLPVEEACRALRLEGGAALQDLLASLVLSEW